MTAHPRQVGMSCKNTRFVKKGLTAAEKAKVEAKMKACKEMWERLYSLNAWKPQA